VKGRIDEGLRLPHFREEYLLCRHAGCIGIRDPLFYQHSREGVDHAYELVASFSV
jgi:hypothetical protein